MVYTKLTSKETDNTVPYEAAIQPTGLTTNSAGTMFFSTTKKKYIVSTMNSNSIWIKKTKQELKLGGFNQLRDRDLMLVFWLTQYKKVQVYDSITVCYGYRKINCLQKTKWTHDKSGPKNGGFKLTEATTPLEVTKHRQNSMQLLHWLTQEWIRSDLFMESVSNHTDKR